MGKLSEEGPMFGARTQNVSQRNLLASGQAGMGLLNLMVGIAVATIVVTVTSKFLSNSIKENSDIQLEAEYESVRRSFLALVDCVGTKASAQCDGDAFQPVALARIPAGELIPQDGKTLGRLTLRAQCKKDPDTQDRILQVLASSRKFADREMKLGCESPSTPTAISLCQKLGGVWSATASTCKMRSAGVFVMDKSTSGIDPARVFECDIRETGGFADLKTCDRVAPPGDQGTCLFTVGNGSNNPGTGSGGGTPRWIYKTNNGNGYKECLGGIYVDMQPM